MDPHDPHRLPPAIPSPPEPPVPSEPSQAVRRRVDEKLAMLDASGGHVRVMERLAPLATLAAGLGHDIHNLLLPMRGHLDSLASQMPAPEAVAHIASLRAAIDYLSQLTDSLRVFALEPEHPAIARGVTNLGTWWRELQPLLASAAGPRIALIGELDDDLPPIAVAPHFLTLVALNLLINSVEAISDQGTIRIWGRHRTAPGRVEFGVTDDGPGMSPAIRSRAFDPFFTTKRHRRGTGLGLPLVHGVARAAGGRIFIDSSPGEGTTVRIDFPCAAGTAAPDPAPPHRMAFVSHEDARIAACFESLLGSAGYAVVRRAPDQTESLDPDTVWVTGPTRRALRVARRLRERHRGFHVVVYGPADPGWSALDAIVIGDEGGLTAIRDTLSRITSPPGGHA